MTTPVTAAQQIIAAMPPERSTSHRYVIALAGPPAAGKSTLAAELRAALAPHASVLGLDAFHYDNAILIARGDIDRKGAPHTFDVDGYRLMLETLRHNPCRSIAVPKFERDLDLTRNAAEIVSEKHSILITEGNYLLLMERPWSDLHSLFDLTVSVRVTIETLEARILERWRAYGLTDARAAERFETNDGPNARVVIEQSRSAQIDIGGES